MNNYKFKHLLCLGTYLVLAGITPSTFAEKATPKESRGDEVRREQVDESRSGKKHSGEKRKKQRLARDKKRKKAEHVASAIRHLKAAGLHEEAKRLSREEKPKKKTTTSLKGSTRLNPI